MMSLTYVDDMIDGIEKVAFSEETDPVELGALPRVSVFDLAEKIIMLTEDKTHVDLDPREIKEERLPSLKKAVDLGWNPNTTLWNGLINTIEDFRRRM